MTRTISLVIAVSFLPCLAAAQVPGTLGYQGRLLKSDGSTEAGIVDLSFALFNAAGGGVALWSEQQSVALSEGFYAVALGAAKSLSLDLFDGRALHL